MKPNWVVKPTGGLTYRAISGRMGVVAGPRRPPPDGGAPWAGQARPLREQGNGVRNILTIDVEDWYLAHLEFFRDSPASPEDPPDRSVVDSTLKMLDLLEETRNTATFFVLGSVAKHFPDLVREIVARGHEIASHGYLHRRLHHLSPDEFTHDLERSLEALNKAGAPRIKGYRAPCFSITGRTLWALDVIKSCGLEYDSSIFPVRRRLYGIPDWPRQAMQYKNGLWEFPPATVRAMGMNLPVAGGGYLRMLPYSVVAAGIRNRTLSAPAVFYFHPYELDPDSVIMRHRPKRPYSRLVATLEQTGLRKNPHKIRRLLTEFSFGRIDQYLQENR